MTTLSDEMKKEIAAAVTTAATATEQLLTEKVEGIARQVAQAEAKTTGATVAQQYCSKEVTNTARMAADAVAQQTFKAGLKMRWNVRQPTASRSGRGIEQNGDDGVAAKDRSTDGQHEVYTAQFLLRHGQMARRMRQSSQPHHQGRSQ